MKHHFELKSKDQTKESAILYRCYLNGSRFTYGLGLKIFPELWDESTQRPTTFKDTIKEYKIEIPKIEARITNLKTRIENICSAVEAFKSNCQLQNIEINLTAIRLLLDEKVLKSKKTVDTRKKLKEIDFKSEAGQDLKFIH